jgi:hypothetical protein
MATHPLRLAAIAAAVAAGTALGITAARADLTITQKTKFDGIGERGWGAAEGTVSVIVSGDRMRQENLSHPTGRFLKKFAGDEGYRNASISRLDRKLMYIVNYRDRSYQEWPFESFKEWQDEMSKELAGAQQPPPEAEPEAAEEPPLKCQPVKVESKKTGQSETIAGFKAEEWVVRGDQACENVQTKQTCNMVYTMDSWNTTDVSAFKELVSFYEKQMALMGLDMRQMEAMGRAAQAMLAPGPAGFEQVVKELGDLQGFPVRSLWKIEKGGDCGMGGGPGSGGPSMKEAFKGLFGKKKSGSGEAEGKKEGSEGGTAAPSLRKVFALSTEITSVTGTGASAEAFEPPADFKKKDLPKVDKGGKS